MLQIALLSDFANINGGQAKVTIDTAVAFAQAGHKVHFCAGSGKPDPALDHININVTLLGEKDILSEPNRSKAIVNGIWNKRTQKRVADWLKDLDPDGTVLHCHGYAKVLSPSIGPLLALGTIPTVYTMHEYFLACPNGGFYDYQKNEICTRKALGASCLTVNCDARHVAHKVWRVARQAATWGPAKMPRGLKDVIYISQTQRKAMTPYISSDTRLHYVPNPVPTPNLPNVDFSKNDIFLFIGRLNPEKGGLLFAKAAKNAGVRAVFVGDGPEANEIRAANPDAIITGWQTPEQVHNWIGKARSLVFPSLWYEGQPLVPMEALARGLPVIAGNWSAAHESIRDGVNGIIYHENTMHSLSAAMQKVLTVPPFPTDDLKKAYSLETYREKILKVYKIISEDAGKST